MRLNLSNALRVLPILPIMFGINPRLVLAQHYTPPPNSTPPPNTVATGTRGNCKQNQDLGLTALAPYQHIGQTTSQTPVFIWYVPTQEPSLLEFQIYPLAPNQPLQTSQVKTYHRSHQGQGLMSFSIPEALEVGQTYVWRVNLMCNPNRPSTWITTQSWIKVMSPPAPLTQALQSMTDVQQRAQAFAKAGFWFDALREVTQTPQTEDQQPQSLIYDLAQYERPCTSETTIASPCHQEQLRKIASQLGTTTNSQSKRREPNRPGVAIVDHR